MGTRVRAAGVRLGWSREALAVRSELSWSAIAQVESGRRKNVRPQTLSALAEALGVTIDYLVHSWYTDPAPALRDLEEFVETKVRAGAPWVRFVGDPDWTGTAESETSLWTRYESLVNLVFANSPTSLLCAYDTRTIAPEVARQARLIHPHMIGAQGVASNPDYADPGGFVLGP